MLTLGPRVVLAAASAGFRHCHAASLAELADGSLLAAFFAGDGEGAGNSAIWTVRGAGQVWDAPRRTLAEPGLPHWNPVLHTDSGRVLLFCKVGATTHDWVTRLAVSADGGATWGVPRALVAGDSRPRGPVRNKLLVAADGAWLAPGSTEDARHWDAFVDRSADGGRSWTLGAIPIAHEAPRPAVEGIWSGLSSGALWESDPARAFAWDGVIQPTLWESAPGMVHALMRSTRGYVYRSDSRDGGRGWCAAYPTLLPNNNSGLDLVRMADGRLVLACNPVAGNWQARTPLALLVSGDNGDTWRQEAVLEEGEGEFSYPAIIAGRGGEGLHVAYTADRRAIVHREIRCGSHILNRL